MLSKNRIYGSPAALCAGLVSLFALIGCASGPKNVEIKATADALINRDASGRSLSVVVQVYQLKDAGEFSKLTSDVLASGRPVSELLGKDLLEMTEVTLVPGGAYARADKVHQDAIHVGIVAFFRQPDQQYWRMLVDADHVRSGGLNFRVQDCFLTLVTPKPSLIPGQPTSPPAACPGSDTRPSSVAATPISAQARQGSTAQNSKRSSVLDAGRQAVDPLLTKKP